MVRIGALLFFILIVLTIVDIWKTESNLEKRLLWTVVILLVPFVGSIAWYLISRKIINL
ncbi:MAG TPA: PLD nuclease N-terminal domain-containing protein [Cyclobacteriaceae bacterium]|jgi:hypothetical protein|nr:PLD nuclease N-terminal domain-containing protein [Cyclobacteriaceae bacterium]